MSQEEPRETGPGAAGTAVPETVQDPVSVRPALLVREHGSGA